jgi:hypothetical protein
MLLTTELKMEILLAMLNRTQTRIINATMDVIANVRHHWTCTQFFIGRFIRVSKTLT